MEHGGRHGEHSHLPVVIGLIVLLRSKLGDTSYENLIVIIFKWWIGLAALGFSFLYIYSHYFR